MLEPEGHSLVAVMGVFSLYIYPTVNRARFSFYNNAMPHYTDIDRDGHEISCFGGLPRELYFPKGLYFPEVRSTEGKHCPEGKYNYLGTTDT